MDYQKKEKKKERELYKGYHAVQYYGYVSIFPYISPCNLTCQRDPISLVKEESHSAMRDAETAATYSAYMVESVTKD